MGPDGAAPLPDILRYMLGAVSALGLGLCSILWIAVQRRSSAMSYSTKLSEHLGDLVEVSAKVDALLRELQEVAQDRELTVRKLEGELASLHDRGKEMRRTIAELENVPVPVADRLATLLVPGER